MVQRFMSFLGFMIAYLAIYLPTLPLDGAA